MDPWLLYTSPSLSTALAKSLARKNTGIVMRLEIRNLNRIRMIYSGETASSLIRNLASDFANAAGTDGEVYSNHGYDFIFCLPGYDEARANELYRRIRKHCKTGILTDEELIPVDITGGAVKMPDDALTTPSAVRQAALFASEEAY